MGASSHAATRGRPSLLHPRARAPAQDAFGRRKRGGRHTLVHAASAAMRPCECLSVQRRARPALQREPGVLAGRMRLPASSREAPQGRCRARHVRLECSASTEGTLPRGAARGERTREGMSLSPPHVAQAMSAFQVTDIGMATAGAATEDTPRPSRHSQDAADPCRPADRFDSWRPAQRFQGTGDAASGRHCSSGRAKDPTEHELGLEARFHATASTKRQLWKCDSCCCKVHRTSMSTSRSSGASPQAPARRRSVPRGR